MRSNSISALPVELVMADRARVAILLELEGRQVRVVLKGKSTPAV
jgi:hypothetical protein